MLIVGIKVLVLELAYSSLILIGLACRSRAKVSSS